MSNRITNYTEESNLLKKLVDIYGIKQVVKKTDIHIDQVREIMANNKNYIYLKVSQKIFKAEKLFEKEITLKYRAIRLQSQRDRLWQVIFLLCMLLIIQAGMIINLSW
jgi:hypothetical protein